MLENLTKEEVELHKVPISDLLNNSLFYPSCGFDANIIRLESTLYESFVFCDYGVEEKDFLRKVNSFLGYKILGIRKLNSTDLMHQNWKFELPPNVSIDHYLQYKDFIKPPFAYWVVYDRLQDFRHGAKRFSLIYIGGEGVATYQSLYWSNQKTAKGLAIIQPGHAFGMNWTNFTDKDSSLAWVVLNNKYGTPKTIYYGGYGDDYSHFNWDNYNRLVVS
jgi:hypothetical protein